MNAERRSSPRDGHAKAAYDLRATGWRANAPTQMRHSE
jgi:hypothetical protein